MTRVAALVCLLFVSACSTPRGNTRPGDGSVAGDDLGATTGTDAGGSRGDASGDAARPAPLDSAVAVCATASNTADPLPATLLFQIDESNSMNCRSDDAACRTANPTASTTDSRWDVLRNQLGPALGALPDTTTAGLMLYRGDRCSTMSLAVPFGLLSSTRATITSNLAGRDPAGIGTPTPKAVEQALVQLRTQTARNRFVVLVTDGDTTICLNCQTCAPGESRFTADEATMIAAVRTAAMTENIRTFVIGVPGSQAYRGPLSQLAQAGGTARAACSDSGPTYCHFDLSDTTLDFSMALRDALAAISGSVVSCEYEIPPNPSGDFDPMRVNVKLTEDGGAVRTVPRDRSRATGWDYSDDGMRIILHGATCNEARALRQGRIDVEFGCATILI